MFLFVPLTFTGPLAAAVGQSPGVAQKKLQQNFLSWRFGMFLHFNMGTFANREWATGYEDPALFKPEKLDCRQWADAAKAAGMQYAILTVKHTGGWCLWDSTYTTHDMAAFENYKNGKGDIVREFINAFRRRGLKVGFYYCLPGNYARYPFPEEVQPRRWFGATPPGTPDLHGLPPEAKGDYAGFIQKQVTELLTNYGPIDEMWFDQYTNPYTASSWKALKAHVKSLQPNCIVVANNAQSLDNTDAYSYEYPWRKMSKPGTELPPEGNLNPSEVCDTLEVGAAWFWHPDAVLQPAGQVASLVRLCNARNANYLLNVPPNRDGLISDRCLAQLREIGKILATSPK
jgi:alpha-L-fucosidase